MHNIKNKAVILLLTVVILTIFTSCKKSGQQPTQAPLPTLVPIATITPASPTITLKPSVTPMITLTPTVTLTPTIAPAQKYTIVIDAGHQIKGNSEQEPIGPGAVETKAKVSSGTQGCVTGLCEYELNLSVALKLKRALEAEGFIVIMTRTDNNVNISNSERAQIANNAKADAFIRIHANGSEDSSVNGVMTICQTKNNPYNASIYEDCYKLSENMLDCIAEATGANRQMVWETDTMSGINWVKVPSTIIEMGYMSNLEEDTLLATEEYQNKIITGIINGLKKYLNF